MFCFTQRASHETYNKVVLSIIRAVYSHFGENVNEEINGELKFLVLD